MSSRDSNTKDTIMDGTFLIKKYREYKFLDLREGLIVATDTSNATQDTPTHILDSPEIFRSKEGTKSNE